MQNFFRIQAALLVYQLKYHTAGPAAAICAGSSGLGCAVNISLGVEDYAGGGTLSVRAVVAKAVQDCLGPGAAFLRRQLEHCANVVRTSRHGCAIKIAVLVEDQVSPGAASVNAVVDEVVQHLLGPSPSRIRHEFENCALPVKPTRVGGA